jgi:hypothetical protein
VLKKTLLLLLASAVLFDFTGCAMSAQARRERAYRHYVAKQKKQRQKEMARAQREANRELKRKTKNLQPSEPVVTTSVQDFGMPSVFDSPATEAPQPPAPAPKPPPIATHSVTSPPPAKPTDSVAPPVTVSASADINIMATQNPDQPSPP